VIYLGHMRQKRWHWKQQN